jgi:type I restriction enzyme S subunit
MAAEWRRHVTFAELVDEGTLEIGDGYRAKNEELGGSGPIFLRAGHVTDTHIDFEGVERFHAELEPRLTSKMSKAGDAIITTKGNSTGRTSYVSLSMPRFVYSPHLSYWRARDRNIIDGGFLHYWSKGEFFRDQLLGMKTSTDMAPYLSLTDQRKLSIALPPINEQRSIAHILGTLDDRIEANRRMAAGLEEMARALFRSWFFGFEASRTKADVLIKNGILEIGDGYRAKNTELGSPGLPFIRGGDLNLGFDTSGADVLLSSSVEKAGSKISKPGDVAFTSKGTIGRFARVSDLTQVFVYSPQICYWRSLYKGALHPSVLYCWMQSADFLDQVQAVAGQTDMAPYVSLRDQRSMEVPEFPADQAELGERLEPLLDRKAYAEHESRIVVAIRDALLPKLVSGAIRVKDAEAFLKERNL